MNQPAIVTSARATFVRRAFYWWLAQGKTRTATNNLFLCRLQLDPLDQAPNSAGIWHRFQWPCRRDASGAAHWKAVLVTDNLPFMHRLDGAPLIRPILFKSALF